MLKSSCFWLFAATSAWAATESPVDKIINQIVARDKVLVERRRAFDYDIDITREKLNADKKVASSEKE